MSKHAPHLTIDPQTLSAFQIASRLDDRKQSVRAGVILALNTGLKVKDVATEWNVNPETVTNYRKKFEAGGIED